MDFKKLILGDSICYRRVVKYLSVFSIIRYGGELHQAHQYKKAQVCAELAGGNWCPWLIFQERSGISVCFFHYYIHNSDSKKQDEDLLGDMGYFHLGSCLNRAWVHRDGCEICGPFYIISPVCRQKCTVTNAAVVSFCTSAHT